MSRDDPILLSDSRHWSRDEDTRVLDERRDEMMTGSLAEARDESRLNRISVLIGAAISQFPIWGFAMSYGVFQEYYVTDSTLTGDKNLTGIVGTTSNGVMYLSMPILFAIFTKRWARWRRCAAMFGVVLSGLGFFLSSYSTAVWHLIATQGVVAALGCALVYSPTTLSLGEWYATTNRTVAYASILSCKNIVGSSCPWLFRVMIDRLGSNVALRGWTAITVGLGLLSVLMIPTHPLALELDDSRVRKIPWTFLRHRTFYIYSIAIMLQSCGYGLPQSYLITYAKQVTLLSQTSATLMLTLFNFPGIIASSFFGYLSQNERFTLSATTVTFISAMSSACSALLLWGLTSPGSMALLVIFSITFGFFAGGYSATWGGVINEFESEAAQQNEAIDLGMMYGLLNGARGVGYVFGGLVGVRLLKVGDHSSPGKFGYSTEYGPLIIFTGLSSIFGGWSMLWKVKNIITIF